MDESVESSGKEIEGIDQQKNEDDAVDKDNDTEQSESEESQPFNRDPVEMALSIPLILETILNELHGEELTAKRLVSPSWNEMILKIFPKKRDICGCRSTFPLPIGFPIRHSRHLNLNKLFVDSNDKDNSIVYFEPKLAKRIYFYDMCSCHRPCNRSFVCSATRAKFLEFCRQFSDKIEFMYVDITQEFASHFRTSIINKCPNLKVLYIIVHLHPCSIRQGPEYPEIEPELETVPSEEIVRNNLETIELEDNCGLAKKFHGTLQQIINSAPNLRQLVIQEYFQENFYPQLNNNKKLLSLSHCGKSDQQSFSQKEMSRMLGQVKNSLEILELKTKSSENPNALPQKFKINFPVMKKMKKLIISDILTNPLEETQPRPAQKTALKTMSLKFPNLQVLSLSSTAPDAVQAFFDRMILGQQSSHQKLHTLIVDKIKDPSVFSNFSNWFPNLKTLDLMVSQSARHDLSFPDSDDELDREFEEVNFEDSSNLFIGPTFAGLKGLKLKKLVVRANFKYTLANLVRALHKNREIFEGMDFLEIRTKDPYEGSLVRDNLELETISGNKNTRDVFCNWLENTAINMKSIVFHGFSFAGKNAMILIPLIHEKKIPIKFTNRFC